MKLTKKLVSILLAVMLAAALFSIPAMAGTDALTLTAEASGESSVVVTMKAAVAFNLGGLTGTINIPDGFTLASIEKTHNKLGNPNIGTNADETLNGYVGVDSDSKAEFAVDDVVLIFTFNKTDAFEEGTEYTFTFTIDEQYDSELDDYEWNNPTTTYIEQGAAPVVYHTVTFMNGEEEFLVVDDVVDGQPVAKPSTYPEAPEGKRFAYWALDGAKYDFSTPVTGDITLTAVFEEIPSNEITITKKVEADVEYPEIEFEFEVGDGTYEGPVDGTTAPAITGTSVTMSGTEDEATATINLDDITWPAGGVYTYPLTEKDGQVDGWEYDDTEYTLVVTVEPLETTGELAISSVIVKNGDEKGEVEFNNTYAPLTDLTIEKIVADTPTPTDGFGTEEFSFTITFSEGFEGTLDGEPYTFGTTYEFTLKNGDSIVIGNIPAGITYSVTEAATPYYTASADIVNGSESDSKEGEFGEGVSTGDVVIAAAAAGTNKVTVTNTYSITPPTGVTIHGEMIGIIVLALVALAGSFVISRKLRRRA